MADVRSLFGRGSVYTVAYGLQAFGSFLLLPFITRALPQAQFGQVVAATVAAQLLSLLAPLGLTAAITRAFFNEQDGRAQAVKLAWQTFAVALGVCAVGALTCPLWRLPVLGSESTVLALLTVLTALAACAVACAQAVLRAENRKLPFVGLALGLAVGGPSAGLVLSALTAPTAEIYMQGYAVASVLCGVVGLACVGAPGRGHPGVTLASHFRIGWPTIPHTVALYALNAGDRIIMQNVLGLEAVAEYQIAYLVGGSSVVIANAVNNAWAPMVYAEPDATRLVFLANSTRALGRLGAVGICLLLAVAPLLIAVLSPAEYDSETQVRSAAIVALCGIVVVHYLSHAHRIFVSGRTTGLAISTPVAVGAALALTVPLIEYFGQPGAALATLVGYMLQTLMTRRVATGAAGVKWSAGSDWLVWVAVGAVCSLRVVYPNSLYVTFVCVLVALGLAGALHPGWRGGEVFNRRALRGAPRRG